MEGRGGEGGPWKGIGLILRFRGGRIATHETRVDQQDTFVAIAKRSIHTPVRVVQDVKKPLGTHGSRCSCFGRLPAELGFQAFQRLPF